MVKLRLRRGGRKKSPHYRIVAADSRFPRDGRFIEIIGYYCPVANPKLLEINIRQALVWLKNGAQPTETVRALLKQKGVMTMWHQVRHGAAIDDVLLSEGKLATAETAPAPPPTPPPAPVEVPGPAIEPIQSESSEIA